MTEKFELRFFDDSGKGPDIVVRGDLKHYDLHSEYDEEPNLDPFDFPRFRLARRWIEFTGDVEEWTWNAWRESIAQEADPVRVRGGVREGTGGPEDQGGVREPEGPVG